MRTITLICILATVLPLAGCQLSQNESPQKTPLPPSKLLDLPVDAQVRCFDDPNLDRGESYIWELPGVDPSDANSAYQGARGKRMGVLAFCTWVKITNYSWSETDEEFWVFIESDGAKGWIKLHLLDLAP